MSTPKERYIFVTEENENSEEVLYLSKAVQFNLTIDDEAEIIQRILSGTIQVFHVQLSKADALAVRTVWKVDSLPVILRTTGVGKDVRILAIVPNSEFMFPGTL